MSFPKALSSDKTWLFATALSAAIVGGIYVLRPEISGFTVTIVASIIAFAIGRTLSAHDFLASGPSRQGRAVRGFYQTARIAIRKRPAWPAAIRSRELADGHFRVEDWQHGEYA